MAVKWAVANGQWSAGATWNGGVVPTIDDDVELNGHTIAVSTNIVAKTLKNENGGYINCNATTLSVSIGTVIQMSATTSIIRFELSGSPSNFVFSCNIEQQVNKPVISVVARAGVNHSVLINGNITLQPYNYLYELTAGNIFFYLAINGNVTSVSDYAYLQGLAYNTQIPKLTINGLCQNVSPRVTVNTFDMNGRLEVAVGEIVCTNFNINGSITYVSTTNTMGVRYTTLNILNPDTFTWKDITEPRSNPFIIVTNADMNNHQQYPPEDEVKEGTEYVWGEKVGTYQQPPESVVLKDYVYDNDERVGTLDNETLVGCVTKEDVREGVPLIGMYEDGQQVVGTIVIPAEEDVREGVHYDNNKVGTLIVQGGGDRLRIADFGYYTRSTSITYIVDLTESDKPAFADCEEIVLRSLFPTLDLDNISDKFFDDLFVQFLRYRLLVEYYRGTSINSKFTPSEPTSEIVNYANTKCEYWLNTANLFLQLWGEKYPNSVKRDRILL